MSAAVSAHERKRQAAIAANAARAEASDRRARANERLRGGRCFGCTLATAYRRAWTRPHWAGEPMLGPLTIDSAAGYHLVDNNFDAERAIAATLEPYAEGPCLDHVRARLRVAHLSPRDAFLAMCGVTT